MDPTAKMVPLSVAVVVRDDSEALRETLECVRDLADQRVVLDTGSSDDSREVAHQAGAELHEAVWSEDFSAARNACLSHASGRWVLHLDAGETLTAETVRQLRRFVVSDAADDKAYALVVRIPPPVSHAAAEQIARVRLVPNHPALRFSGRIRESLSASLAEASLRVEGLPYRIDRGQREHEPQRRLRRARRNLRLAELEIGERGPLPHLLVCMGNALQSLEDNDRAAQAYRHALRAAVPGSLDMLEAYYGLLTSLDGDPQHRQLQLDLAVEATEVFPLDAQLLCALGGYLHRMGRTDLAQQSYETAFRYGQINPVVWHVGEVREIAAICLSITQQVQNELDKAEQTLRDAILTCEGSDRVRRYLIELLVQRAKRDEALEQVGQLPAETPHRQAFRSAVRGACFAAVKNWTAARPFLRTAYHAGCRETLCLRWLAITAIAEGQTNEARQILEDWGQLEPGNPDQRRFLELLTGASAAGSAAARQWRLDGPAAPLPNAAIKLADPLGSDDPSLPSWLENG